MSAIYNDPINNQEKVTPLTSCAGCPIGLIARTVLGLVEGPAVVAGATGCLEVTSTIYPNTSWKVPYIHSVFANAAATIAGVETAWKALKKRQRVSRVISLPENKGQAKESISSKQSIFEPKFIAFAGDGGSYDIGLQALSGALERRHNFLFVTYDNEGYMNTGHQRSGATPLGASTQTTPAGRNSQGKRVWRKDLFSIVTAHRPVYAATANIGFLDDFKKKIKKALAVSGPSFLLVFSPCVPLWKYPPNKTMEIAQLGTETNFWPLYEYENGRYRLTYRPTKIKPVAEFCRQQGRFKHLFSESGQEALAALQEEVNNEWARVRQLCAGGDH